MNKTFNILILTILAISPITYMKSVNFDVFDLLLFHVFCSVAIIMSLFLNNKSNPKILSFIPILAICLLGVFLSGFNQIITMSFLNLALGIMIVMVVANNFTSEDKVYVALLIPASINLLVLLGQNLGYSPIIENLTVQNTPSEPGGILGSTPRLCMYLAIILPIIYKKNWLIALLMAVLALVLKEIYLIFFWMVLVTSNLTIKKRFFVLFSIAVIVLPLTYSLPAISQSIKIRLPVWLPTIEQALSKPMLGYGLGIFPHVSKQFITGWFYADTAFSSLIQFLFSVGIPGILALVYLMYHFFKKHTFNEYDWSIIFLSILSIFEYPFEVTKLWLTICILIGIKLKKDNVYG